MCVCVCSRRRSSSLGSCDEEKEELSSVQLSKRIHVLKKKIHRFEEKFEYERKYRVSHAMPCGAENISGVLNGIRQNKRLGFILLYSI